MRMQRQLIGLVFIGMLVLMALGMNTSIPPVYAQEDEKLSITSEEVEVMSGEQAYVSYLAAPTEGGPYPGIVLIHSFRGLEEGYRTMTDEFAARGFVVLAV